MNHHACDLGLVFIVRLGIGILRNLCHVLEIQKAAEGISLRLMMHHLQSLSVLVTLTMHWTCLDHHELLLVVLVGVSVVLGIFFRVTVVCRFMMVIQMIALLVVLHHHLLIFKILFLPF